MRRTMFAPLLVVVAILLGPPALAQHCGGPCEVPRPAGPPISLNPKFKLVAGKEKNNWRYLHNFIWTEDGVQKFKLEETLSSPQMIAFGYRRIFVSPAGNGFLVTGNGYANDDKFLLSGRTHANKIPLFVFCDPRGTPIVEVPLQQELKPDEIKTGDCPAGCGCKDILYVFKQDPAISANGCYVELVTKGTGRTIRFCLPLGSLIDDRDAFEDRLAELEWERIPKQQRAGKRAEIEALVKALDGPDFKTRDGVEKALLQLGFLALPTLRASRGQTDSPEKKWRLEQIETQLKPWAADGYEAMSVDLDLLSGLLTYPEAAVVQAVQARLAQLVPDALVLKLGNISKFPGKTDWGPWLEKHRDRLQWDAQQRQYTLRQ